MWASSASGSSGSGRTAASPRRGIASASRPSPRGTPRPRRSRASSARRAGRSKSPCAATSSARWKAKRFASSRRRPAPGSRRSPGRLPRVEDLEPRKGVVRSVAGHEPQPVDKRGRRDERIDGGQGAPGRGEEPSPPVRGGGDGKNATFEPGGNLRLEPGTEAVFSRSTAELFYPLPDLTECEHADEERRSSC